MYRLSHDFFSRAIWDKSALVSFSQANQTVLTLRALRALRALRTLRALRAGAILSSFEKFTYADLSQIAREKSYDYYLIIYNQKYDSVSLFFCLYFVSWLTSSAACLSIFYSNSRTFSTRICFKLVKPLSRIIERLFSFSVRYQLTAVTITQKLSRL